MSVYREWSSDGLESSPANPRRTVRYVVDAAADEDAAMAQLQAARPTSRGGLASDTDKIVERLGHDCWLCEATYVRPEAVELPKPQELEPPDTGDSRFEFEFGLTNTHITTSKETTATYGPPGENAPNHNRAIGVSGSGPNLRIEGTDVQVPVFSFSETHYLPVAVVTGAYKSGIAGLVGKVNDDAFKGFAAGEVLCAGISGSQRNADDWEISFRFQASENLVDLEIGNITGIAKGGWEHLWVQYRNVVDASAKTLAMDPRAVFIERIYDEADFSVLGIGT